MTPLDIEKVAHFEESQASRSIAKLEEPPCLTNPQPIIKVIIGEEGTEFFVHKDFLCYYSPYFAGALREENFQEATKQSITLEHADMEAFGLFVCWLYTQKIKVAYAKRPDGEGDEWKSQDKPSFQGLINFWVLADYLLIPRLQNLIVEEIHAKVKRGVTIPVGVFRGLYENTSSGSMLRKIFVDFCVWNELRDASVYYSQYVPEEMVREVVVGFNMRFSTRNLQGNPSDPFGNVKNYYVKDMDQKPMSG